MSRANAPDNSPRRSTVLETASHALFPNTGAPVPVRHDAEGRAALSRSLPPHPEQVFTKAVTFVHDNLTSHGHGLATDRAKTYGELTHQIENRQLSNSSGFASAALGWGKEAFSWGTETSKRKEALVGAVFNTAGFFGAGVVDSYQYKTGGRPIGTTGSGKDQQ